MNTDTKGTTMNTEAIAELTRIARSPLVSCVLVRA